MCAAEYVELHQNNATQPENNTQLPQIDVSELPSIQTEETENNNVDIKDDNTIVRKLEGEVELKKDNKIDSFREMAYKYVDDIEKNIEEYKNDLEKSKKQ